jgi:hypothetical protein
MNCLAPGLGSLGWCGLNPLQPIGADSKLHQRKRTQLDRLYQRVVDDLGQLSGINR